MKSTLMVTTCFLALAFSPPAFAHHSHKQSHEKLHAQTHLSEHRAVREHASESKHVASDRSEHRHRIAAIHPRHELRKNADDEHVASRSHHHRWSSSRH